MFGEKRKSRMRGSGLFKSRQEEKNQKEKQKQLPATGQASPPSAWRGSYTVEAALIVPMVIFALAALILAAFYAHDCAVCQSLACEAAVAGSNFATEKERSSAVSAVKKRIKENRFLGSRSLTGNASVGKKSIVSSWKAAFPVPGFVMKYLADNSLTVDGKWTGKIENPTGTIRLIRGAGELLTGDGN